MKKYYYTDPLAAAWMAKHFNMQFIGYTDDGMQWDWECMYGLSEVVHDIESALLFVKEASPGRIYIHPDSIHILESKYDDLIEWESYHGKNTCYLLSKRQLPAGAEIVRIIERNAIPFIWPEVEQ